MVNSVVSLSDTVDMEKICTFFGILLAFGLFLAACDGEEAVTPGDGPTYRVEAVLVKDLSTDSASIFVNLTKTDSVYRGADVALDSYALDTIAAGYFRHFGPATILADSSYTLTITDGTAYDTSFTIFLPDSFAINSPALRFFTGSPEPVSWSPSLTASGYILATQPPDTTAYDGYEAFVATTSGTIPSEVFLDGLVDRIVGTHMIYVASYIGAPSESRSFYFDIPDSANPADNILGEEIVGRAAGIVIAEPDSIIVTD